MLKDASLLRKYSSVLSCIEPLCWQSSPACTRVHHLHTVHFNDNRLWVWPRSSTIFVVLVVLWSRWLESQHVTKSLIDSCTPPPVHSSCSQQSRVHSPLGTSLHGRALSCTGSPRCTAWRLGRTPYSCRPLYQFCSPLALPPSPPQAYVLRSSSEIVCNPGHHV